MTHYTHAATPGYTDAGLRNLSKAHAIIAREHGLDMDCLPDTTAAEIDQSIRDRLTNTHNRNLSVRALLAIWRS